MSLSSTTSRSATTRTRWRSPRGSTRARARAIIRYAFDYAVRPGRKKVTIVHKANVLKALTGVFLEAGREVAKEYEGRVEWDDRIVDACAMQLVLNPWQFDVIVTTNLFGDILSDLMAGLVGGLGDGARRQYRRERGDLRSRARLGARYRRQGHRQPDARFCSLPR